MSDLTVKPLQIKKFTVNNFGENAYVCSSAGEAVIIDPGCQYEHERNAIVDWIESEKLTVVQLLLTHAHIDHVVDCAWFSAHYKMPFRLHIEDFPLIDEAPARGLQFGVKVTPITEVVTDLTEEVTISFGDVTWEIFHCPGHSPGSVCFYDRPAGVVIGGDVLFQGSVGRTDLWKGSMPQLVNSIKSKLFVLPDDVIVFPGHGPETNIGVEKKYNPFLQ